ncbi:hypothetical protein DEA8626_00532 [Defluviimonas aquaemixtae]|uniref:SnoaL-like domain-containing protein n=1 Tax=Albidovulum aquaemixtae TaxID=1542388 RepID=A0A2R8B344_9RHOB|nr:nuclear transport factor 2 family protein [Defluviimonas aquaemixtae]SPH17018.1 hypothetical protein DEA8626_00532 [Defluviimonas aquaemixtae]
MGLYQAMDKALQDRDAEAYIGLLHDDYRFVRHQSGETMDRAAMAELIRRMMADDAVEVRDQRLIYENAEILVEHSVMDFPDGTREAVMGVHTLKDRKILRTETGATLLKT